MRSFYLQIRVSAIENWPFFWDVYPNLQSFLVFLCANLLYTSQIFQSLSIACNEVQLYMKVRISGTHSSKLLQFIWQENKNILTNFLESSSFLGSWVRRKKNGLSLN